MSVSNATKKLLSFSQLKGVGEKTLSSLFNLEHFEEMPSRDILKKCLNRDFSENELNIAISFAEDQIERTISNKHSILSFFDDKYPQSLRCIESPPPLLFCAGNVSAINEKCITVIGTREPTSHGAVITKNLTQWFSEKGWNIVSGLAIGIDSLAHQACLDSGGKTIAVLAHGLDTVYPKKNANLAHEIIENNGTLVTEYCYGSFIAKSNFVRRDSIQAALSSAVFLVQTGTTGGSLHASRASLTFNRPLIVVGQSRTDILNNEPKSEGNIILTGSDEYQIKKTLKLNNYSKDLIISMPNKLHYDKINNILNEHVFIKNEIKTYDLGF